MEEELYVYERAKKAQGDGYYQVRRKAQKVQCLDCKYEWLIRKGRKAPVYCRECKVKGERNPQYGKKPHNKGNVTFDDKAYKRNYYNQYRHELKRELVLYAGNQCYWCKEKNLPMCVWHFHHVDKETKIKPISQLLTSARKDLYNEIDKCVLVCSNCHLILHRGDERAE